MTKRETILERLKQGSLEKGFEIVERLSKTGMGGASRSQVFKAKNVETGEVVALKASSYGFVDSFEDNDVEKLGDFWKREREVLEIAGSHPNIPDYKGNFVIPENESHHEINVLLMQYLDLKSIEDRIRAGEKISDTEAKILLKDGNSALNHLHVGLPYQVLHRDIKPANLLLNGEKAHLIDFDIVKQGDNDKTSATAILNLGYYPAEAFSGYPKPEHDLVALGNVAIAGIAGKHISLVRGNDVSGLDPVDTSNLLVSRDLRDYLGKLTAPQGQRFKTAREAIIGLERIVGMPVQVQPERQEEQKPAVDEKRNVPSGLPQVIDNGDGTLTIGSIRFETGKSPYETLGNFVNNPRWSHDNTGDYPYKGHTHQMKPGRLLSLVNYLAPQHPAIADTLAGKQTLEEAVMDKGPNMSEFTSHSTKSYSYNEEEHSKSKEEFNEKRKGLGKIFDEDIVHGAFNLTSYRHTMRMVMGELSLGLLTPAAYISQNGWDFGSLLCVLGGSALGVAAGLYTGQQKDKRALLKQAREMDSWISEARRYQERKEEYTPTAPEQPLSRMEKFKQLLNTPLNEPTRLNPQTPLQKSRLNEDYLLSSKDDIIKINNNYIELEGYLNNEVIIEPKKNYKSKRDKDPDESGIF